MIKLSINLAKINKDKIKVKDDGKIKDYNIILIETPDGKYGDWLAVEDMTKEEREAGKKGPILGNGKNIGH